METTCINNFTHIDTHTVAKYIIFMTVILERMWNVEVISYGRTL
jgi:hypothetical protein